MSKKINTVLIHSIVYVILVAIALITLLPILYMVLGSLKENGELLTSGRLIPEKIILDNYVYAWEKMNFWKYTLNSLFVTCASTILAVIISSMAAYVLARKNFPGKKLIKSVYIWSLMISVGSATLFPVYKLCIDSGLNGSLAGVILTNVGAQVYNTILTIGFVNGVSKGYDEAATIDGCGFFMIYLKIVLPLIRPVLAVVALSAFVGAWNNYLMPMILTTGNEQLKTLAVAVVELKTNGELATLWSVILAGSSIAVVPVVILYAFTNKQFISGLTLGGLKG